METTISLEKKTLQYVFPEQNQQKTLKKQL